MTKQPRVTSNPPSREIKFRAIINGDVHIFRLADLINPSIILRQIVVPWLSLGNTPDRYVGLKDKNGVEIYERDTVKLYLEILEKDTLSVVVYSVGNGRYSFDDLPFSEVNIKRDVEVIGKI